MIIEEITFPELKTPETPTTPFDTIKKMNSKSPDFRDFPFSMGEIFHNMEAIRKIPKNYIKKMRKIKRDSSEFRERYIMPNIEEIEKKAAVDPHYVPYDIIEKSFQYRFSTLVIPESFGGAGYMTAHVGIMAEELAVGCAGLATSISVNLAQMITAFDPYLFAVYSRESAEAEKKGEPLIWSGALTEPNAGTDRFDSDFQNKTRAGMIAKKVEGGYLLNGSKCFISNGSVSHLSAITAALDPDDYKGTGCFFVVKTDSPGFSVGRVERKMGQKASPTSEQICQDVFVPDSHKVNIDGFAAFCTTLYLAISRGPVGAMGVGCGRRALESLIQWAAEHKNARGRLIDQQSLQMRIAHMAGELASARAAYMHACLAFDDILNKLLSPWYVRVSLSLTPKCILRTELFRRVVQSNMAKKMIYRVVKYYFSDAKLMYIAGLAAHAKIVGGSTGRKIAGEAMEIMGPDAGLPKWGLIRPIVMRD